MEDKRLIEVSFPLKEIGEESAREKNIRHGYISTLHIWWARKPLAASRATIFAALTSPPKSENELKERLNFIVELSKWKNSLNERLIENARRCIRDSFGGKIPKILDCFAAGGSIPLEALRLGCETYALELNPVGTVILKATAEYPQKFGREKTNVKGGLHSVSNQLLEDVKKWGNWVLEEAKKEIGRFYPRDSSGEIPVCYLWARTIKCQNSSCGAEIPLMRQLWLCKKKNKKVALKIIADKKNKKINLKVVQGKEIDFDPSQGTTTRATVLCPVCGAGIDAKTVRKEAREGRTSQRLIAVILYKLGSTGKTYRIANEGDLNIFKEAQLYLNEKLEKWKWDFYPIPNEDLPPIGTLGFRVQRYGILKWGDLFNDRQKLVLVTFTEKVRLAYEKMIMKNYDPEYAKAVATYLALGIDRVAIFGSTLCLLNPTGGRGVALSGLQTLHMIWTYAEANPFNPIAAGWETAMEKNLKWIEHASKISPTSVQIIQGTATRLPYPKNFFDAVVTDPPYYDNVPYSDLSDFFYVWLKRSIGDLYPELFSTPLTPKSKEVIMDPIRHGNNTIKAKKFFEDMITQCFREIRRVLTPDGIAIIVFAYKSTEAWEAIISGLLKSGLVLTASWPIHTERAGRLRAQESAALASSVYMVCRKRTKEKIAYFNEIRSDITCRIKEKLTQFWEQGISGADFFVSAIGPAVEVFGRYSKVEKLSGEEASVHELLEYVRKIVSEFALERVLKRADLGGVDAETRFYLLWRWTFGDAKVHFDDAIKLSRPMGIELTHLWDGGFVKKEKEFIRVLGPKERAKDPAFLGKTKFTSMVDVLHHAVILWERGERERIKEILSETGYLGNEVFWQTAQAISEILPEGNKERQLIQGFLYGKESYVREVERGKRTLLDFMR